jgi:hypothetical protein
MPSTRINVAIILLECVSIVIHWESALAHQFHEAWLPLPQLVQENWVRTLLLLLWCFTIRVKELYPFLLLE